MNLHWMVDEFTPLNGVATTLCTSVVSASEEQCLYL